MKSTDDIHNLTDHIYKSLVDNFNNGIRQILLTGKAYQKALQGIASTAHAYTEALRRVGSAVKMGKGGTQEIGEAILQIAEAQKDIQTQIEDSTKALFAELILPLELKLEKEFKKPHADHRKYTQGHKSVLVPYNKAFDTLKKFRKKTKNKYVYDNEKEAQYMRTLGKCQEQLDEFRITGLRNALLEERRCHCFLLQRLCAVSSRNYSGHKNAMQLYSLLPEWLESCAEPHRLPKDAEHLLALPLEDPYEPMNGGLHSNGYLHRDMRDTHSLHSMGSPFQRSASSHDLFRYSGHFDGTKTLPSRPMIPAPQPPGVSPQVQAVYTFEGTVETQLSFKDGDILVLMGEKSEGWQYGQNTRTGRCGWFPLSFTQPAASGRISPDFKTPSPFHRVRSVGDLTDSRSMLDQPVFYDHETPGNIRRPKSLYDGSQQVNSVAQTGFPGAYPPPLIGQEQIYQHVPLALDLKLLSLSRGDVLQRQSGIYSSRGQPVQPRQGYHDGFPPPSQTSPPLPPPPPPFFSSQHDNPPTTSGMGAMGASVPRPPDTSMRPPLPPVPAPPVPAPKPPSGGAPPPPMPPPPPPVPTSTRPQHAPPLPPGLPSVNPSVSNVTMSLQNPQVTHGNGLPTASAVYASPVRQSRLPPPPLPPVSGSKKTDDSGIEEDVNYKKNPMFSSVSLRRTNTNDRSAPKIN